MVIVTSIPYSQRYGSCSEMVAFPSEHRMMGLLIVRMK